MTDVKDYTQSESDDSTWGHSGLTGVRSQHVTARQGGRNNLCHPPPSRKDRAIPQRRRRIRISIFRARSRPLSPSSKGALRGQHIVLRCDCVALSATQVKLGMHNLRFKNQNQSAFRSQGNGTCSWKSSRITT